MDEFTKSYVDLLIQQYWCKSKAKGEIRAYAELAKPLYAFIDDFEREFDLDRAYGHRLDLIGKIVGFSRIVPNAQPKTYFGFSGTPNARTFAQAPLFDLFNDTGFTDSELDDTRYRFFLKAKIAKNAADAHLVTDDRNSLQTVINILFRSMAYVVDNFDMTLTLYVDESFPDEDLIVLRRSDLLPNPVGVDYKFIIKYAESGTFGFASNGRAKTFGQGKFAQLVV